MYLGLYRVEGVEDLLGLVQVSPGGLGVAQQQLDAGGGDGGVDEGVLRVLAVDLLGELGEEGQALPVI